MVVYSRLDLGYLALFLGQRVNEMVVTSLIRSGFADVRESHGYVIQHLIESERTITELAERMEVTQQAASKVVAEMEGLGILEVAPAKDRRAKHIRLSRRAWRAVRLGRLARQRIEKRLVKVTGQKSYEAAKSILIACLDALGGVERIQSRRVRSPR